jgi:hypothetical protein
MQFPKSLTPVLVPLGCLALVVWAYRSYAWPGVAMAVGALVMWLLLHFTRMLQILKRSADRPIGFVDSAVMLNAKLKKGASLMHVIAMTRALGQAETDKGAQPEVFSWRDGSQSVVRCVFMQGKLQSWTLDRPFQATDVEPISQAAND